MKFSMDVTPLKDIPNSYYLIFVYSVIPAWKMSELVRWENINVI